MKDSKASKKTKYSLLIAEDDNQLRTILSDQLRKLGFAVTAAGDGNEALECIQQKTFDLAILDIKMPGMDGFGLLRYIKDKYLHMKVIMITGYTDVHHAIESKRLGADDFIGKPYDLADLESAIQRVLSS